MRAVTVVMRSQFRQQWRPWLALTLLIALVSGFTIAAAATARRTEVWPQLPRSGLCRPVR